MKYRGCVAFVATEGLDGAQTIGTCFHVGAGVLHLNPALENLYRLGEDKKITHVSTINIDAT